MLNNSDYIAQKSAATGSRGNCTENHTSSSSNQDLSVSSPCLKCDNRDQILCMNRRVCLCTIQFSLDRFNHCQLNQQPNRSMILENPGQIYNYINKCRKWVKVWNPKNFSHKNAEFSLTTYNILSQNLLLNHLYLYKGCSKSDLIWSQRGERLKNELIEMNSDIFCLQEVHMENFKSSILPSLVKRGYQAVFKQKTGESQDGCSILFKKNKFSLQDCLEVEFKHNEISHLLDKDHVGLIVKLRPLGLNEAIDTNIIVANTHLLYNPRRGDIKIAQLRLLLAEIQRFAVNEKMCSSTKDPLKLNYFPVLLCGDMNSEPTSPLINFIEKGKLSLDGLKSGDISGQKDGFNYGRYISKDDLIMKNIDYQSCFTSPDNCLAHNYGDEQIATIRHVFNFKSAYPAIDEFHKKLISMSTYCDSGLVDHIMYTYKHQNLKLSAFRQLMNIGNINSIGNMPNSVLGSDHFSLSAKFYIL